MKKNKYIFSKATPFLVSLLLAFCAIDGYAIQTVGIKGPDKFSNGGYIIVKQGSTTICEGGPPCGTTCTPVDVKSVNNPVNITSGNSVTVEAIPGARRRVVWYVNGYKLQGRSYTLYPAPSPFPGDLTQNVPSGDGTGGQMNWVNSVACGTHGINWGGSIVADNSTLVTEIMSSTDTHRKETLTIHSTALGAVKDVQALFVRDIAHLATITPSTNNNNTQGNGGHYTNVLTENTWAWFPTATDATRELVFTFPTNQLIERIEFRRRTTGDRLVKFQVSYVNRGGATGTGTSVVTLPAQTIDVRDGSSIHYNDEGKLNPDINGDLDRVVFLTDYSSATGGSNNLGMKYTNKITIKLLGAATAYSKTEIDNMISAGTPYTEAQLAAGKSTTGQVGLERVRIIEAVTDAFDEDNDHKNIAFSFQARTINYGVIGSNGSIQAYTGGWVEGCWAGITYAQHGQQQSAQSATIFNPTLSGVSATGYLINSMPLGPERRTGKAGQVDLNGAAVGGTHINDCMYFVAKPDPGYRVKWFKVSNFGKDDVPKIATIANRTSYNYKNIDESNHKIGNDVYITIMRTMAAVGKNGNGWPNVAHGIVSIKNHTAGSDDVTVPNGMEIIGIPRDQCITGGVHVEVEFEKELALYSKIKASHEAHNNTAYDADVLGCKYGVTVGPGTWYPGNTVTQTDSAWIGFKFNVPGESGSKRIGEVRINTRASGGWPTKVRFKCYNNGILDPAQTEDKDLTESAGQTNIIRFCKAKVCDEIRIVTLAAQYSYPEAGYQRIQFPELLSANSITSITVTSPGTTITTPCGTLQFTVPANGVQPSTATYNQPPYFPYTWKVTDTSGNPTKLAAIDSDGTLYPLHKGNGQVKVFAEANDGYGTKSTPIVVTLSNQPQVADTVLLTHNLNHLIASSITDVVVTATLKPTPETAYNKVIWEITPRPTLAKVVDATDPTNTALAANLIDGTTATTILQIKIMRPFLTPATNASMSIKATPVQYTPSCNFAASFKTALTTGGSVDLATKGPFLTAVGCNCSEAFPTPAPYTDAIKIRGDGATNTESPFIASLNLYPVPFATTIQITDAAGAVLQIKNIAGITILTQQISGANETLDLSQLASGMYFFCFEKDGQTKIVKAVKN